MPHVVAAIQYRPLKGAPETNRARLAALLDEAGAQGAAVAVTPEMGTTGYVWTEANRLAPHAERADGPTRAALAPVARRHNMWIVAGFAEQGWDGLYNSALILDPAGEIAGIYRKVSLFVLDTAWARPGAHRLVVPTALGPLATGICRDLVDDAFTAWLRATQPRVFAFCTNWVPGGEDVHAYWLDRLDGFGGVTLAANGWGEDRGVPCSGRSAILAQGYVLAQAPEEGDGVVIAEIPELPTLSTLGGRPSP